MEAKANPNTKLELLAQYDITASDVKRYVKMAINEANKKVLVGSSSLKVGCAVMTSKGKSFLGSYVEDPWGSSITAEDFALHKALSEGELEIKMLVVHYSEGDKAVYRWPDGKWRQNFLHLGHFVMVSCRSENDFIVKSSASLLPYSSLSFKPSQELWYPDPNNISQLLNTAIHYTSIEFNEKHR